MLSAVPSSPRSEPDSDSPIATVPEMVDEIRRGNIVVLVDDEDSILHKRSYFRLQGGRQTAEAK